MSHPFGDLVSQYLHRQHGLSQAKLAAGILQTPSVISEMCKGQRLTGVQARERVLQLIGWLREQGALTTTSDANALLEAAGMAPLRQSEEVEAALLRQLQSTPQSNGQNNRPPVVMAEVAQPSSSSPQRNLSTPLTDLIGRKVEADKLGSSREMAEKLAEALQIGSEERIQFSQFARDKLGLNEVLLPTQKVFTVSPYLNENLSGQISPLSDAEPRHRLPLERPPRAQHFIGRKIELTQLLADLQPGRVVTLCGPGGIGKTALAAEAVWQLAPSNYPPALFPDGILFHSFYSQPQVALALEHIARSFGEEPKPTPKAAAQRALADRRLLLVLDGAEEADDLRQVVDIRNQCGVLVTSRQRKDAVAERQDVVPLPPDEAVALLQAWGGERASVATAARSISELVGGLPLALRLVGRYLAQSEEDAGDYLVWLAETPLIALDHGQRREESIPLLLMRSLTQLSELARRILSIVGVLALVPFERNTIMSTLEVSDVEAKQALGELVNYGLLLRPNKSYIITHTLIYTYARLQLPSTTGDIERLVTYYTNLIKRNLRDFALLDTIRVHVLALLHTGKKRQIWAKINDLAASIDDYLNLQGYWTDRITVLDIGLVAAQTLQIRQDEGYWQGNLGNTYRDLGQVEKSINYYQKAMIIAKEIGDGYNESNWLGSLGNTYSTLGQAEQAINYYQQALAIAKKIGNHTGEGNNLINLGAEYSQLGQIEMAISYCQQALDLFGKVSDRLDEGYWLSNLSITYRTNDQVEQAINYHQQAIALAKKIGDRRTEGAALGALGLAYADLGQVKQSINYYQQAIALAQKIGDRRAEGAALGALGLVYADLGQVKEAINYHQQAIALAKKIGDRWVETMNLNNLGKAYHKLNQFEQAIPCFEQAFRIARESGFRNLEGEALRDMGNIYRDLEQVEQARQLWEEALQIFEGIKSPTETVRQLLLNEYWAGTRVAKD